MSFFQRGLLIYLCIAIAVCMSAPQIIFDSGTPAENSVLSWFQLQYDSNTNSVTMINSSLSNNVNSGTESFQKTSSPAASGSLLGFIDPIYQVFSWIPLIFKVIFSPIILLTGGSAAVVGNSAISTGLMFVFAIPAVFLMIIALIMWLRSGY